MVCDTTQNRCAVTCTSNAQCAPDGGGGATPYCNTTTMRCVQCLSNTNCTRSRPTCTASNVCM